MLKQYNLFKLEVDLEERNILQLKLQYHSIIQDFQNHFLFLKEYLNSNSTPPDSSSIDKANEKMQLLNQEYWAVVGDYFSKTLIICVNTDITTAIIDLVKKELEQEKMNLENKISQRNPSIPQEELQKFIFPTENSNSSTFFSILSQEQQTTSTQNPLKKNQSLNQSLEKEISRLEKKTIPILQVRLNFLENYLLFQHKFIIDSVAKMKSFGK